MKYFYIIFLYVLWNNSFGQTFTLNHILKKFKSNFSFEFNDNLKEFTYDYLNIKSEYIYTGIRDHKKYFLYQIDENVRFKFLFLGNYDYLSNYGTVTNARDFILFDKEENKLLLLKYNTRGLLMSNDNKVSVENKMDCFGRLLILLNHDLNEIKTIESINEFSCMDVRIEDDGQNTPKVYKKVLTNELQYIPLDETDTPLFDLDLEKIYQIFESY